MADRPARAFPTIGAARTYEIVDFRPVKPFQPRKPTELSFTSAKPDGQPLTAYKRGAGPHTGVHLIFVRSDLGSIIHTHPPIAPDGTIRETLTFPDPGRYRMVVDVYPATGPQPNFQLFRTVRVAGPARPMAAPAAEPQVVWSGGYRFAMQGKPRLKAIQAQLLDIDVTDARGRPATFEPYYGALAHAIFFRKRLARLLPHARLRPRRRGLHELPRRRQGHRLEHEAGPAHGRRARPGARDWRLFLQTKLDGRVITAPFTLQGPLKGATR